MAKKGKVGKKEAEQESGWKSAATILGVISAALGIVLSVYNIRAAWHQQGQLAVPDEAKQLEIKKLRQEASASAPRFEVAYVTISQNLYQDLQNQKSEEKKNQTYFLNYPIVPDEVAGEKLDIIGQLPGADSTGGDDTEDRVTCLVLQNKGKRDALDVKLDFDRLGLNQVISIQETPGGQGDDYVGKFRQAAASVEARTFDLPMSIPTGSGVLIPLFASRNPTRYVTQRRNWFLISNTAYLPKTITFTDPLDNLPKTVEVRRMKTPTWIDPGYEVRG
jgi:cell division protein FtsL